MISEEDFDGTENLSFSRGYVLSETVRKALQEMYSEENLKEDSWE